MQCDSSTGDCDLQQLLEEFGLGDLPRRFKAGFDHIEDWSRILSRGEQQRLAAVRCMVRSPRFAVLDEATSALSQVDEDAVYRRLCEMNISLLSVGHRSSLLQYHGTVLELSGHDQWKVCSCE